MNLVGSALAQQDLIAIRTYIGHDDPEAARRVAQRIRDTGGLLTSYPYLGRMGREADTRELPVPRAQYLLIYSIRGDSVEIFRVIHGAQRWPPQRGEPA